MNNTTLTIQIKIGERDLQKSLFDLVVKGHEDVISIVRGMKKVIEETDDLEIVINLRERLQERGVYGVLDWHDDVFGEFGMDEKQLVSIYSPIKSRIENFNWDLVN